MVKQIKQNLYERLKAKVPSFIRKIQILSASVAGLDMVIIAIREKFPDIVVPDMILQAILYGALLNALLLQFTTHKDFEK